MKLGVKRMLKIKDEINLKELNKFGFTHWQKGEVGYYQKQIHKGSIDSIIIYDEVDRFEEICCDCHKGYIYFNKGIWRKFPFMKKKYIKDLIKGGYVEKVRDKNEK